MLAGVWADGPGVGNSDVNYTRANGIAAGWGSVREISVRVQDF